MFRFENASGPGRSRTSPRNWNSRLTCGAGSGFRGETCAPEYRSGRQIFSNSVHHTKMGKCPLLACRQCGNNQFLPDNVKDVPITLTGMSAIEGVDTVDNGLSGNVFKNDDPAPFKGGKPEIVQRGLLAVSFRLFHAQSVFHGDAVFQSEQKAQFVVVAGIFPYVAVQLGNLRSLVRSSRMLQVRE